MALAIVGLAPLLVTGCGERSSESGTQDKTVTQSVEKSKSPSQGRLSERFSKEREVRREITRLILENQKQILSGNFDLSTNNFLKYYTETLGKGGAPPEHEPVVHEGRQMRMLEIAGNHGVDIHKMKERPTPPILQAGGVPLVFEIDGKRVEVANEDLTDRELEVLQLGSSRFQNDRDPQIEQNDDPKTKDDKNEAIKYNQEVRKILERLGVGEEKAKPKTLEKKPAGNVRQSPNFDKDADF